jgi:hypothetical protein
MYTPTTDYNPATKKYVDDKVTVKILPVDYNKNCATNVADLEPHSIYMSPNDAKFLYLGYEKLEGSFSGFFLSGNPHGKFIYTGAKDDTKIEVMLEGICYTAYFKTDTVDAHTEKTVFYLTKNNNKEFTPTIDYEPATKKYVDDNKIAYTISSKVLTTVPASSIKLNEPITVNNITLNKDRKYYIEFLGSKKLCSLVISETDGNSITCSIGNYSILAYDDSSNITINIDKINEEDTTVTTFTDLVIYEEEVKCIDNKYLETDLLLQNSISLGRIGDIGAGSSAIGGSVIASGVNSHAEGDSSTASGYASHAEGSTTTASGVNSHAEGDYTTASGASSHAEGYGSKASSQFQHVQGKYNIEDKDRKYAHIVGNGAGDAKRSNAHTLDWKGNGWYAGKLSQEGTPTENKDLATKKYVDDNMTTAINGVKGDLGTEELTTVAKDLKGAVNELNTQYKDIVNDVGLNTFDDCIYNRSALKNINNREFFSMVIIGDSIGAGTAATDNYGFTQRFVNTSYYHQGFAKYTMEYFYYKEATGWTKEENGINLQTISSSNASKEFFGIPNFPWVLPTNDYKVAIVYCKKTDGGQFDIKDSDDKILTTIDCSGENNLGCISDYFTVGAGKAFKICPKQDNKAYVIAAMIDYQPEKKGYKIVNWSVGGRQLCDYTKDEIKTMILYDSFDTVYCELFANDSAMGKFDEYFDKLTYLIDTAKNNKKDVILNITNRNEGYDATEDARVNFKKWENKMYEIAKKKNCCLINFDKLIGGHTVGKANGLIADTIHPNNVGHEIMAKLLNFVIFKDSNTYEVNRENTIYAIYGKRHISEEQYYNATQYFNDIKIRVWDENGNKNSVAPVMPIIRHWVGTQGYTKFAQEGALGSTGRLLYINQNNINTQANWRLALTSPFLETVTTIPTVNDDNKNTIFRYRQEGKDDQIIVCVKVNGTEQFKSIQLVDII